MKNRGFTLIELITVIVLLGIIASIIVPKINVSINESKKELVNIQDNNIEQAARSWAADNIFKTPKNGKTIYITLGDLKNGGYIEDDVINPSTKEKYPDDMIVKIISGENGKIIIDIEEGQENKFDPMAPKIVLKGSAVVYIEVDANDGDKYREEGVKAYDKNGEEIKDIAISYEKMTEDGNYEIVDGISTSIISEYRITYSVTDRNLTSRVYRNVIVRDTTPPKIKVDGHTTDYAMSIPLGNNTIKVPDENDVVITDNSCNPCNITPTIKGTVKPNAPGVYEVFYKATDASGNSSKLILKVFVSVIPTFTFERPSISMAKEGSIVIYKMHLSEQEYSDSKINPQDFIINKTGTANAEIIGINQDNYDYEIIIRALNGDGTISITPKAGIVKNIGGGTNEAKPTSESFIIDNSAPNGSFEPATDNWYRENVSVNLNIDDSNGLGIGFYCITNSESCTPNILYSGDIIIDNEGKYKICARLIDKLGNEKTTCSDYYKIDKTAPTCEVTGAPTDWVKESVHLTVRGTDNLSGVVGIKHSSDSTYGSNPLDYLVSSNGTYKFNVIDRAGNINECGKTVDKIDTDKPTITNAYDEEGWSSTNKKITIVAEDSKSGIAGYQITNTRDIPSVFIESNDSPFVTTETYPMGTYYAWVKDKAGNISNPFEVIVDGIDMTKPNITLTPSPSGEWTKEDIYIDLETNDDESGIDTIKYCVKNTDTSCEPNINLNEGESIPITSDGDNYYVCVSVTNHAGLKASLCSNYDSKYYKLDKTYPSCDLSLDTEACVKGSKTATLTGTDVLSGLHELPYAFDDGDFGTLNTKTYSTNGSISGKVRDKALNINTCSRNLENIDNEKPEMGITLTPTTPNGDNGWYKTQPTLKVSGSDTGCGGYSGYKYQVSINGGNYSSLSSTQVDDSALNNEIANNECKTIKAKVTGYDGVSNTSTVETSNFKYDKTAPVITVDGHTSDYSVDYTKPSVYEDGTAIYYNPVTGKICDNYVSSNSRYQNKSGCMKWYIFNDEASSNTVNLLLDHNTTYKVAWNSSEDKSGVPVTANAELASDVSGWIDEAKNSARLITADEVWEITKSTNAKSNWSSSDSSASGSFYFEGSQLYGQGTSKYAWLFDYLMGCTNYGCNIADSGAYGFWTSSPTAWDSNYAFYVYSIGQMRTYHVGVGFDDGTGIRPVITINRSLIPDDVQTYELPTGTATDNCGGSTTVTTSGSVNTSVPGSYPIKYNTNDSADNTKELNLTVNVVDNTAPVINSIGLSSNTCTNENVTATVDATDDYGLAPSPYSFDDGLYQTGNTKSYSSNGDYNVKVKDGSGNEVSKDFSIDNIDKSAPSIDFSSGTDTNGKVYVKFDLNDTDCGNSRIDYLYCVSNSDSGCTPDMPGSGTSKTISLNDLGNYKICVNATDGVGNSSGVVCSDVYKVTEPLMRKWSRNSNVDFHNDTYRTNIVSVEILDNIPDLTDIEIDNKWDVSEKKDEGVMAWVTTNSADSSKYDLHIAGNGGVIANPDSSNLFFRFENITTMDLSLLDTSRVTDMNSMFYYCESLTSLDLGNFNTSSVTNMSIMFAHCYDLTSLNLRNFNTSKVTSMASMFYYCYRLTNLDLSNFGTSNVTDMSGMFEDCKALTSLNLSSFNTSKVTNMSIMFLGCKALTSLDLSNFNTSNVTDMHGMFKECEVLTSLDVSNFDISQVTDMGYMFWWCRSLATLDLSNFDTSQVTDMSYMFYLCEALTSLDIRNFTFDSVTSFTSMFSYINRNCIIYVKGANEKERISSTYNVLIPTPAATYTPSAGTYMESFDITITPNKWYTKDVSYLYCLSSNGEECTPNIPGVGENTTLNISENGKYKICTSVAGNGVTNIECSNSYVLEKMKVYDNGTAVYFNPETGTTCSNYTASQSTGTTKAGCLKWYIFNDEKSNDTVDMILDHNTTYEVKWNSSGSNVDGPSVVLTQLQSDTSSWTGVPARTDSYTDPYRGYTIDYTGYRARLIEANEVWKITQTTNGASGWNSESSPSDFYFEGSGLSGQGTSKYPWLYDYTEDCTSYGCNTENGNTLGYLTSSASAYHSECAWVVSNNGYVGNFVNYGSRYGVRPVITISKSILS